MQPHANLFYVENCTSLEAQFSWNTSAFFQKPLKSEFEIGISVVIFLSYLFIYFFICLRNYQNAIILDNDIYFFIEKETFLIFSTCCLASKPSFKIPSCFNLCNNLSHFP